MFVIPKKIEDRLINQKFENSTCIFGLLTCHFKSQLNGENIERYLIHPVTTSAFELLWDMNYIQR